MTNKYFFDSYALFEIVFGNEKYLPYAREGGVTCIFNIAELNYGLKKQMSGKEADKVTDRFRQNVIRVLWDDIKTAMDMKTSSRDFSIPDSIGYVIAKRLGIKFLTGDEGFRDLDNVEFVKK